MSTKATGYAIEKNGELVEYNVIKTEDKDILNRFKTMFSQIKNIIEENDIELIVAEDVPISNQSNLDTGKGLCILQGLLLGISFMKEIDVLLFHPTEWRKNIGLQKTIYTCKKCGNQFEDISGIEVSCKCGNDKHIQFNRNPQNKRPQLKQRAVDMANEKLGLNLYFKGSSKKNEDDIAEAICLYLHFKELRKNGKKNI